MDDAFIFLFSNAFISFILASLGKDPRRGLHVHVKGGSSPKTNLSVSLHQGPCRPLDGSESPPVCPALNPAPASC